MIYLRYEFLCLLRIVKYVWDYEKKFEGLVSLRFDDFEFKMNFMNFVFYEIIFLLKV